MINRKVRSIVLWLINNDEIEQNDFELYEFAIYSLIFSWSPLIMSIIFGAIIGIPIKAILMIIPFMAIRKFSGGYHVNHAGICFFVSSVLMFVFLIIIKYTEANIIYDIFVCLSVLLIVILSPVDSENRKLSEIETKEYKLVSMKISMVTLIVYGLARVGELGEYSICFGIGLILTALLLIPCLFKKLHYKKIKMKR